jgi:hypothetical protein
MEIKEKLLRIAKIVRGSILFILSLFLIAHHGETLVHIAEGIQFGLIIAYLIAVTVVVVVDMFIEFEIIEITKPMYVWVFRILDYAVPIASGTLTYSILCEEQTTCFVTLGMMIFIELVVRILPHVRPK